MVILNVYVPRFWFLSLVLSSSCLICCRILRSPISDLLLPKESSEQILQHDVGNVESQSNVSRICLISWWVLFCLQTIISYDVCVQDQISASASMVEISHSSENGISDTVTENTEPAIEVRKAPKAGERAQKEVIDLWKENGFSRYLTLNTSLTVQRIMELNIFSFPFAQSNCCCTGVGYLDSG